MPRSAQHKIALMLHTRYWSISISRWDCITLQIRCRRTGQFKLWLLKCRWTATEFGNDAENFNYRVIRWTNLGVDTTSALPRSYKTLSSPKLNDSIGRRR